MPQDYAQLCDRAPYKLTASGERDVRQLLEAFAGADPDLPADSYGTGALIEDFEQEMAALLGKEKAVFFPSGTMAQQIAARIWSDEAGTTRLAYHPLCHMEIHEQDGLKQLHHLTPVLLGEEDRLFTLDDLRAAGLPLASLVVELPQREIGGQVPSWEELSAIVAYCREQGVRTHLDGARLFEVLPYYGKSAAEIAALFDSVYLSFYKGLGGIAGAILAGPADFIQQATVWKRRHGGDLISLYPYIVSSRHAMELRSSKMGAYWAHAQAVAEAFNAVPGIHTLPTTPVCNMFHAFFDQSAVAVEQIFADIIARRGVCLTKKVRPVDETHSRAEFSLGDNYEHIPPAILADVYRDLAVSFSGGPITTSEL